MFEESCQDNKQKVHFLHVGKTGGSAVKHVLKDFLITPKYSLILHNRKTSLKDIPHGDFVIFFLRDPISRFVSGFYSRQRKGQPRYYVEWRPIEKDIFEHFSTPNAMAIALSDKQSRYHSLAIMGMENIEHFKPYSKWYIDLDYFKFRFNDILFIGFQESLDADFSRLKKILAIPRELALPTDDIIAHKNKKYLNKMIDQQGIFALNKWYLEDFKFISFCRKHFAQEEN